MLGSPRPRRWLVSVCCALVVSGCSASVSVGTTLETDRLEGAIESGIEEQTGAEVTAVECPESVKIKKGSLFDCTVTDDKGETGTVRVRQQDDKGNVKWQLNP